MKLSSSSLLSIRLVWILSTFLIECNPPNNATDSKVGTIHNNPTDSETIRDTVKSVNIDTTANRCSELAGSVYKPVTIERIIALGRDSSGTVYMIDQFDNGTFRRYYRAFVSKNDTLYRKKIKGSGIRAQTYYTMSVDGIGRYIFKNESEKWSDLYICTGTNCREYDSILSSKLERDSKEKGEVMDKMEEGWQLSKKYFDSLKSDFFPLDNIEKSDIQDFRIKNFEPKTRIERFASLEDGRYLLISSNGNITNGSDKDWEIVVHFGKQEDFKLCESPMIAVSSFTYLISFLIDSLRANARFTKKQVMTDSFPELREGPAYLFLANDSLPLKRLDPSKEVLTELGFNCTHTIE